MTKRSNNLNTRDETQRLPTKWNPVLNRIKNQRFISETQPITGPITHQHTHIKMRRESDVHLEDFGEYFEQYYSQLVFTRQNTHKKEQL